MSINICDRKVLRGFLTNKLEEDARLDFLFHLDECPSCWDTVYNATKAEHPHFYKRPVRKPAHLEPEIAEFEKAEESDKVFEVA